MIENKKVTEGDLEYLDGMVAVVAHMHQEISTHFTDEQKAKPEIEALIALGEAYIFSYNIIMDLLDGEEQ